MPATKISLVFFGLLAGVACGSAVGSGGGSSPVACVNGTCSGSATCVDGFCKSTAVKDAGSLSDSADSSGGSSFISACVQGKCASQIGLCTGGCATWLACAQKCAASDAPCQTDCAKKVAGDAAATSGVQAILTCMATAELGCNSAADALVTPDAGPEITDVPINKDANGNMNCAKSLTISNVAGLLHGAQCTNDADCKYGMCKKPAYQTGADKSFGVCTKDCSCGAGSTCSLDDNSTQKIGFSCIGAPTGGGYECAIQCAGVEDCIEINPKFNACVSSSTFFQNAQKICSIQ